MVEGVEAEHGFLNASELPKKKTLDALSPMDEVAQQISRVLGAEEEEEEEMNEPMLRNNSRNGLNSPGSYALCALFPVP